MNPFRIRWAIDSDKPALQTLQQRSLRGLGQAAYDSDTIERFIAEVGTMDDYLVADRSYLVAEAGDRILGCGGWTTRSPGYARHAAAVAHAADPGSATIRSLYVDPLGARQGIGRALMHAIEDALRERGFDRAELGATANARRFYRNLGYRALGEIAIALSGERVLRLTRMRKTLAAANENQAVARTA